MSTGAMVCFAGRPAPDGKVAAEADGGVCAGEDGAGVPFRADGEPAGAGCAEFAVVFGPVAPISGAEDVCCLYGLDVALANDPASRFIFTTYM